MPAVNLKWLLEKLSRLKLPALGWKKSGPSAGLIIRPEAVELLVMRGRSVTSRVHVPIEGAGELALTQAISNAVAAARLTTKRLAVSILSPDIVIRFFTLPPLPKAEWDTAAQFEARKYVPFKMDSLVWDCAVLQPAAAGRSLSSSASTEQSAGRLEVVFCAIPREIFSRFQSACSAAGVQAVTIEPLSVSLARLVAARPAATAQEFVCLVDIGRTRAHIVIARDGIPYLTREVNLSDEAAAGAAEVSPAQAAHLLSELSVSMDFFMREYASARIANTVVLADEERLASWCRLLAEQLSCAVEPGGTLVTTHADAPLPLPFAPAVGLLQAATGQHGITVDFLKRERSAVPAVPPAAKLAAVDVKMLAASMKQPRLVVAGLVAASVPLAAFTALGMHQVSVARQRLQQVRSAQARVGLGLDGMTAEAMAPLHDKAAKQLTLLKQIIDGRVRVAMKLDALARLLPDGIWMTNLTFDNPVDATSGKSQPYLTVSGACFLGASGQEFTAIQGFEDQVKKDAALFKGFDVAQLGQITASTDQRQRYTYRTFQLNCRSERKL